MMWLFEARTKILIGRMEKNKNKIVEESIEESQD
jgi:hypothetical protein